MIRKFGIEVVPLDATTEFKSHFRMLEVFIATRDTHRQIGSDIRQNGNVFFSGEAIFYKHWHFKIVQMTFWQFSLVVCLEIFTLDILCTTFCIVETTLNKDRS